MPYKDKETRREYFKKYRELHREDLIAKKKAYYNSEQGKKTRKEWKEKNHEKVLEIKRAEYKRNKEHYNEYDRKRAKTEKRIKQNKEYYKKNKNDISVRNKEKYKNDSEYRKRKQDNSLNYRNNNKEKIQTTQKKYYKNNKEKILDYHKNYCLKNKTKLCNKKKIYNENRKIFYGRNPYSAAFRYFHKYTTYISSFKNYLLILKQDDYSLRSMMGSLSTGWILEDEALNILKIKGITWTEDDEIIYQKVISEYNPKKIKLG